MTGCSSLKTASVPLDEIFTVDELMAGQILNSAKSFILPVRLIFLSFRYFHSF